MTPQKFLQNPHYNFLDLKLWVCGWGTKDLLVDFGILPFIWIGMDRIIVARLFASNDTLFDQCLFCRRFHVVLTHCPYSKKLLTLACRLCGSDWMVLFFSRWPASDFLWETFSLLCLRSCSTLPFILSLHLWSSSSIISSLHLWFWMYVRVQH